ncbi:MAG: GIY-YIG nuclease family protein [Flavonifractor plautii]
MSWWVYILRCGDGTLYTGTAADVERRLAAHRRGGSQVYPGPGPLAVVYREACPDRGRPSGGRRPSKSTGGRKRKH